MNKRKANMEELLKLYFEEEEEESSSEEDFPLDHKHEQEHEENYMGYQNIQSILSGAEWLAENVEQGEKLDDWIEDKLSVARASLSDVIRFLKHGHHNAHTKKASIGNFQKELFAELRTYFQDKGSLEGKNKIVFLNDTEDLFEFIVEPTGYVKVLVNHHLFLEDTFMLSKMAMKEIKKQINDHVYGF